MINIIKYKKNSSSFQLLSGILSFYKEPASENTDTLTGKFIDIILKSVTTFLFVLAISGIAKLIFELITNPSQFSNATFGVFDYL